MAYSQTISQTSFNANRVVDHAFRRCRLPAQSITAEMQSYALDALYLLLSELPNPRTLSWCIERLILPMYRGNPQVELPLGTISVLNANYRSISRLTPDTVASGANSYSLDFGTEQVVAVVGVTYSALTADSSVQTSVDGSTWVTVAALPGAKALKTVWVDIVPSVNTRYLRVYNAVAMSASSVIAGSLPYEIPLGQLNQDTYTNQTNKVFEGRPQTYWFQRNVPQPVLNLWPAPNSVAEFAQIVVWRQRHIMDVGSLRKDLEVPQRWLNAVTWMLAYNVALETPAVDVSILPLLKGESETAKMAAYDGDSDGAPTYIQPYISAYTR